LPQAFALSLAVALRLVVDRAVLLFALDKTFRPEDFAILTGIKDVPDGAIRLHPQLARNVVKSVDAAITSTETALSAITSGASGVLPALATLGAISRFSISK
jgi:hypothetical protein